MTDFEIYNKQKCKIGYLKIGGGYGDFQLIIHGGNKNIEYMLHKISKILQKKYYIVRTADSFKRTTKFGTKSNKFFTLYRRKRDYKRNIIFEKLNDLKKEKIIFKKRKIKGNKK